MLGVWALLSTFLGTLRSLFRTQRELALENLALRQQIAALVRIRGGRHLRLGVWDRVLGPGGQARRAIRAALTDDARYGLVAYLAALGCEVVLSDALVRADPIAQRSLHAGLAVWAAPDALATAIARAAAITDPARLAAVLARWPRVPLLRAQLRRLATSAAPSQVPLL